MDAMEVDEVVDLSVGSRNSVNNVNSSESKGKMASLPVNNKSARNGWPSSRRTLRPRTEMSYAELPDVLLLPEEIKTNGLLNGSCDEEEDCKNTYFPPVKELTPAEMEEKARLVRKYKNRLRNEEMVLVLLKKLRQSQLIKENVAVVPPQTNNTSTSVTMQSIPVVEKQTPPPRHSSKSGIGVSSSLTNLSPHLAGGNMMVASSSSMRGGPIAGTSVTASSISLQPQRSVPQQQRILQPSVTITPRVSSGSSSRTSSSHHSPASITPKEDRSVLVNAATSASVAVETPAQRQAAAKLALRKQLEKTLLQIPPPKPPPPEMHFIPNPSNTEFIYLIGLEHIVDYITKDSKSPPPPEPFSCSQCSTNFTPVWKWEKGSGKGSREPRVICEQCVTSNVKKALKAEHTNRLKTAFVKALQQEQEIEQRLAQASPEPPPPPPPPPVVAVAKPPPPPPPPPVVTVAQQQPKPSIPSPQQQQQEKFSNAAAAAAGLQLLRGAMGGAAAMGGNHGPLPAHMLPFSPLLYPYQLAMANASKNPSVNLTELQRQVADFQRQYLLEMMPAAAAAAAAATSNSRHSVNNWKI